ncbi:MAG: hypothetical protein KBB86_02080 [Candidatus Pacebacteria bacterium]|nr:hypothetical protein [Candidatus Paceibacterota bacterium]
MEINPEHMPYFTQTNKNSFKKSGIIVGLAYVTIFISVACLLYFLLYFKSFLNEFFWILILPHIFIVTFTAIIVSTFAVSVLRSKNENEYKITKRFLITSIFVAPTVLIALYLYGFIYLNF